MDYSGKTIWITGASSGIGKYLALVYAGKGGTVAVSARRMELLEALVTEIESSGGKAKAFFCDVTHEESIKTCVQEIINAFARIDIAIANAGFGVTGLIKELTETEWERQLRTNVTGLALTAKYALPHLENTKGRLALIGSVAAFVPNPLVGAYGASKAAVHIIGETLQAELFGSGVSCTTIHPGFVDSNITRVDNEGVFYPERKDPRPVRFMWATDVAAAAIVKAIEKRKKVFVFTSLAKVAFLLSKFFPGILRKTAVKQMDAMRPSE